MKKIYTALGTMSGTSLDGIDFSIIQTDGEDHLSLMDNKYLEFSNSLKEKIFTYDFVFRRDHTRQRGATR